MNGSKFLPLVGGGVAGAVLVVAVLSGGVWLDNRELRARVDDLREQQRVALGALDQTRRVEQDAQAALRVQADTIQELNRQINAMQAKLEEGAQAASEERRNAVKAQVYAGRHLLGDGWVFVGGRSSDGLASAAVTLDEQLLKRFIESAAKAVAADQRPRDVTVNHNYASTPYWNGWWPIVWSGSPSRPPLTNRPPSGGIAPRVSPVASINRGSGGAGIWRPTQKPFLPNPSPWPGTTPPRPSPLPSSRVNPALPATQPVLLPSR